MGLLDEQRLSSQQQVEAFALELVDSREKRLLVDRAFVYVHYRKLEDEIPLACLERCSLEQRFVAFVQRVERAAQEDGVWQRRGVENLLAL